MCAAAGLAAEQAVPAVVPRQPRAVVRWQPVAAVAAHKPRT